MKMREITINIPATQMTMEIPEDVQTFLAALDATTQGKRIKAIKEIRRATGWGLLESKIYIDELSTTDAEIIKKHLKNTHPEFFL